MKTKFVALFLAGMILGSFFSTFIVARLYAKQFRNLYLIGVMDQANVALHVKGGQGEKLLQTIEAGLPQYVQAVHDQFPDDQMALSALWMVKAYYERNEITAPEAIAEILASLPAKPPTACQQRLRKFDEDSPDPQLSPAPEPNP